MRARHYRRIAPRLTRSAAGRLIFNRSAGHFLERREANEGRGVFFLGGEVNQRRAEAARTISDVASGTDSPEKEPGSNSNAADRWLLQGRVLQVCCYRLSIFYLVLQRQLIMP